MNRRSFAGLPIILAISALALAAAPRSSVAIVAQETQTPTSTVTMTPTAATQPPPSATLTATEPAYFRVGFTSLPTVTFVIKVTHPQVIAQARMHLDQDDEISVMGIIVKEPAPWNPPWSYHLDPDTVSLFEFATEVCDANPLYVEEHLDEACGHFLPDCRWCPWSSFLMEEIPPPNEPTVTPSTTPATTTPPRTPPTGTQPTPDLTRTPDGTPSSPTPASPTAPVTRPPGEHRMFGPAVMTDGSAG